MNSVGNTFLGCEFYLVTPVVSNLLAPTSLFGNFTSPSYSMRCFFDMTGLSIRFLSYLLIFMLLRIKTVSCFRLRLKFIFLLIF
jgi:hypothetical protein